MDADLIQGTSIEARYVRFGPFCIDQQRQQVSRNGDRLRLQGKVYQVLIVLLQRQGEVVTRDELKQAVWPADTHVNYDANVNTAVNKLRQALDESADKSLYIATIPRKGYSFISTAEFSAVPFVVTAAEPQTGAPGRSASSSEVATDSPRTKRWLILMISGLFLAAMLLGACVATYWISHFAPQLRHSAATSGKCVPSHSGVPRRHTAPT